MFTQRKPVASLTAYRAPCHEARATRPSEPATLTTAMGAVLIVGDSSRVRRLYKKKKKKKKSGTVSVNLIVIIIKCCSTGERFTFNSDQRKRHRKKIFQIHNLPIITSVKIINVVHKKSVVMHLIAMGCQTSKTCSSMSHGKPNGLLKSTEGSWIFSHLQHFAQECITESVMSVDLLYLSLHYITSESCKHWNTYHTDDQEKKGLVASTLLEL